MPLYGTVTRLAPAGHHPPRPSHQIQSFMKKLRQPVLLDVNVFDKDAAVGEMVGACVSPELVGGGVGACVVTAQAGAQLDRVGAHPLTVIRARAQRAW